MMAFLSSAIPLPLRALLVACASASFTIRIFSASPFSLAATLNLCASFISFIAAFTFASGSKSVTKALTIP